MVIIIFVKIFTQMQMSCIKTSTSILLSNKATITVLYQGILSFFESSLKIKSQLRIVTQELGFFLLADQISVCFKNQNSYF